MKEAGITVTVYPDEPIIVARLTGFWGIELVRSYEKARLDALRNLRGRQHRPEAMGMILEATDFEVQSLEVADALSAMAAGNEFHDIHVAVVIESALRRIQAERIAPRRYHYFGSIAEAENWLRSLR